MTQAVEGDVQRLGADEMSFITLSTYHERQFFRTVSNQGAGVRSCIITCFRSIERAATQLVMNLGNRHLATYKGAIIIP